MLFFGRLEIIYFKIFKKIITGNYLMHNQFSTIY